MSAEFKVDDKEFKDFLTRAQRELSANAQDAIVEKTAHTTRRELVNLTPSRSGSVRNAWSVVGGAGGKGSRQVINANPVMRFLEYGTPEKSPGAKIYPKKAKALAIPKLQGNAKSSMSQTVRNPKKRKPGSSDKFTFVKWVHGMKPKKIVEDYLPKIGEMLMKEIQGVIDRL